VKKIAPPSPFHKWPGQGLRPALLLWALFCINILQGQGLKYSLEWYTDSDGLPQNSVKDIVSDTYGYIWISTENGVVRYDGRDFKVFNNKNHTGFTNNRMLYFEGNIKKDSIVIHNVFGDQLYIREHRIWPVPRDSLEQQQHRRQFILNLKNPKNRLEIPNMPVELAPLGKLRYSIEKDSIREFDTHGVPIGTYAFPSKIGDRFFTLENRLYVLKDNKRIHRLDNGISMEVDTPPGIEGDMDIFTNKLAGQVFLFNQDRLYLLRDQRGALVGEPILEGFDFAGSQVFSVLYDPANRISYIGSRVKGLCIARERPMRTILTDPKDLNKVEYALLEINDSTLLNPKGALIINGKYGGNIGFGHRNNQFILDMDRDGNIWGILDNRLLMHHAQDGYKSYTHWDFEKEPTTLGLLDGALWVATFNALEDGGVLYRMEGEGKERVPKKVLDHGIHMNIIEHLDDGLLLIGSNSGLYELRTGREDAKLELVGHLGDLEVRSLYKTGAGIWVTTYGQGIFLYRNGQLTPMPQDRDGFLATSHCILEDAMGYFWISTNKGLFQVAKQALLDFADRKRERVNYQYYDKSDGLKTNEFNGGCSPCAVIQADGRFSFPSLRGVVNFDPGEMRPKLPGNALFLDEIRLDDKILFPDGSKTIDRRTERLTFTYSSPHYGNVRNNVLEVKLEGALQHDWIPTNADNSISYTSLAPGDYLLTARKMTGFDAQYTYHEHAFRVEPAFWQTLWFKVAMVLLGMFLTYQLIRFRLRYVRHKKLFLEKKVRERTSQLKSTVGTLRKTKADLNVQVHNHKKLLASLTHDIKTPLKYLSLTSGQLIEALERRDLDGNQANMDARSIHSSSMQLYRYIDNLVAYTKVNVERQNENVETFDLFGLTNEKLLLFQNIVQLRKIDIQNHIAPRTIIRQNRQLLSIVIHNLLDNAIKNTQHGSIRLKYSSQGSESRLTLEDTGNGMGQEQLGHYRDMLSHYDPSAREERPYGEGMGLWIIAELLLVMDVGLKIESRLGQGTRIDLCFKDQGPGL